jgi:probable addiction module antidote protein
MTTAPGLPFRQTREAILQDAETAALYLEEALAPGDDEAFKLALRHAAEARLGGIASLAEATGLNRETLYRILSPRGNSTLDTLHRILHALGLRVAVRVES